MNNALAYGLFGKLPAKRDFVSLGLAPGALSRWEDWLQREIAQSRQLLESTFVPVFLRAPIWRFWCGASLLGRAALGILMPSVDGVGRYFPLTLLALAPEGQDFAAPFSPEAAQNLAALEELALGALDSALDYEAFLAALSALPVPETHETGSGAFLATGEADLAALLAREEARLRATEEARARATASRWWTAGGEGFAPQLAGFAGLPEGANFAGLFSGRFAEAGGAP